jgi:tetratricopeptide (TPR) repeat protein
MNNKLLLICVAALLAACTRQPSTSEEYRKLAGSRYLKGDRAGAMELLNKCIAAFPAEEACLLQRGAMYFKAGKADLAIQDYSAGIKKKGQLAHVCYDMRGNMYMMQGRYDLAAADFTQRMALLPGKAKPVYERASAYMMLRRYPEAIEDYSAVIGLEPKYPDAYQGRGMAYSALGENELAIADLGKAIELSPEDPALYAARAELYTNAREQKLAEADRAKAKLLEFTANAGK